MKILLIANYKPDLQKSMARYADFLYSELRQRGYAAEIHRPAPIVSRLIHRSSGLFRWLAYIDKFVLFPPLLWFRSRRADIVHVCDHSNSSYLSWTGNTPSLITAHDALAIRSALGQFPQNPTRRSGVWLQRWILNGMKRAQNIVCVSQKTRRDFELLLPPGPRMSVIPNPISSDFKAADENQVAAIRASIGMGSDEEYLLHVGGTSWYKNRTGVLRIFAQLKSHSRFARVKLVMAGSSLNDDQRNFVHNSVNGITGDVLEYLAPSDSQLRALYTGALALLFPSLAEGFGWPILEAQACGCPVITSDRPPMNEVAGAAAIFIDPDDPSTAAAVIAQHIGEAGSLSSASMANVKKYAAATIMDRYCELYREIAVASPTLGQ